jgi:hypothetical protein
VFSTHTTNQLTGLFASNVWDRLVLQACESSTSIRHAVIAIGALDPKTWRGPAKSQEETLQCQFAYYEYSMAIRDTRKTILENTLDLRTRLIACLLFICFEIYHCNKASAVAQIKAISSLLKESCEQTPAKIYDIDNELLESFQELEMQALIQTAMTRFNKLTTTSQLPPGNKSKDSPELRHHASGTLCVLAPNNAATSLAKQVQALMALVLAHSNYGIHG